MAYDFLTQQFERMLDLLQGEGGVNQRLAEMEARIAKLEKIAHNHAGTPGDPDEKEPS